jgi:Trk-type K+ transport system membrane component
MNHPFYLALTRKQSAGDAVVKKKFVFDENNNTFTRPKRRTMKNLLSITFIFLSVLVFGQVPQKMNYQAVVRNASGQSVANGTQVVFRFTIHDVTPNGSSVFTEDVTDTVNQFGLCATIIGNTGNLATVNWDNGDKYLQVESKS